MMENQDLNKKETASEVPVQKQVQFTEHEIFCLASHLQMYIDRVENKLEDYNPCNTCKFVRDCFKSDFIYSDVMNKLVHITGLDYLIWARVMNTKLEQQEQLNKGELECIYRHLKMFIFTCWDKKKNVPDACVGCGHYCSENKQTLNPWPAFYKLSNLIDTSYSGGQGASK